jgi:hypothetical protein
MQERSFGFPVEACFWVWFLDDLTAIAVAENRRGRSLGTPGGGSPLTRCSNPWFGRPAFSRENDRHCPTLQIGLAKYNFVGNKPLEIRSKAQRAGHSTTGSRRTVDPLGLKLWLVVVHPRASGITSTLAIGTDGPLVRKRATELTKVLK